MAADEVSAAIASLFSQYGGEYQAMAAQAVAFHGQFTTHHGGQRGFVYWHRGGQCGGRYG